MEKPKDRDFVETLEGMLFCVVGYLHPPDRYTAYLKYVPEAGGKWRRGETCYSRVLPYYHVSQVENTYKFLKEKHPQYVYKCPVRNIIVSSVPHNMVKEYYRPRERLKAILNEGPSDKLEDKLVDLMTILRGLSGLRTWDLGVTGSILTGHHNPDFSDMDLTVYGREASIRLKETVVETRDEENVILPFSSAKREVWSRSRAEKHMMSFEELMDFAERRWNYGVFRDTYFSIHPVRTDDEIIESYGDFFYRQLGTVSGKAEISDTSESIYLPAVYCVVEPELEGVGGVEVKEIVSYEGLFCDMFEPGEKVWFSGVLEQVTGKENRYQVVVGGAGSAPSYIKRIV